MKKYLILTASYWSWHNTAAEAIEKYLVNKWDNVDILDLTDLLKKWWDNSRKFYSLSEKMPFIWDATFTLLDQQFTNEILNIIFKSIYQKEFNDIVNNIKPDYIICTFPNWPIFINNYCNLYGKKFTTCSIITDAIEIWMPWYFCSWIIDYFFFIDENSKIYFRRKFKHKINNLNVSFFPIETKYFLDKSKIGNQNIAILLTWMKKDFVIKLLEWLKKEFFYKQILVIKWRNDKLFNKLKVKNNDSRFEYYDFISIKEELKNIDIFITKPGWAIMSECIAQDVPIIAPNYIPWQEEWNIKLIEIENLWIYEDKPEKIIFDLKYIDWNKFLPNFQNVKKSNSIESIIKTIEK